MFKNEIESIEKNSFTGLSNLDYLHLGENSIDVIEANLFEGLNSLVELYLYSNKLRVVRNGKKYLLGKDV